MATKDEIKRELWNLTNEVPELMKLCEKSSGTPRFGTLYQGWYSRALKLVALLGTDRLDEFRSYYLIDPKRKNMDASNYVIQDYIKGIGATLNRLTKEPLWDIHNLVCIRLLNQQQITQSLATRIDGILADVEGHILADLEDEELNAARKLITINLRAAGALARVILERHLQRVAAAHNVPITKREPTIADLNDPLKQAEVYDLPVWRRIQLLADLGNLCSHQKKREPTRDEVEELLSGVNKIIKTVF